MGLGLGVNECYEGPGMYCITVCEGFKRIMIYEGLWATQRVKYVFYYSLVDGT
jgi:hypothetical protein